MNELDESQTKPLSEPTPSQLTMLIPWERQLQEGGDHPASTPPRFHGKEEWQEHGSQPVTSALMALREEGAIEIEYVEHGRIRRIVEARHVRVRKTGPSSFPPNSFEGELWARLDEKPTWAFKLVRDWFGDKKNRPWEEVIDRGWNNLVEAGLLVPVEVDAHRGRIGQALLGKTKMTFRPHPQAVETLPRVQECQARLRQPDELRGEVLKEVRDAIRSKLDIETAAH